MIPHFYVLGSKTERPASRKTIFADGSADATYRPNVDLELSHWVPNRTPERYRADTSTEICLNFDREHASEDIAREWDLAVNNHLDCDGILSVYALVHSETALRHRETIIGAAQMGDFWAWGNEKSQVLFQGLTLYYQQLKSQGVDIREVYERCFELVHSLLENGRAAHPEVEEGLAALARSTARVESGEIARAELNSHFALYRIPRALTAQSLDKTLLVPAFNAALSDMMWLIPSVRDRYDREKMHLVAAESPAESSDGEGWFYDLWYPGYMWAETSTLWRAPGFAFKGSTNGYYFGYEPLEQALKKLQAAETGAGVWTMARELSPFSTIQGRNYPVILSYLDGDNRPAPSRLLPEVVAEILAEVIQ
jgi:hypothetical protein